MKEQIDFRKYTNADNHKLSLLFKKVFAINRDDRYCQWKYNENPAGTAISSIAEHQGRIIGQIGIIPIRFCVNGRKIIGVQEVDFLIEEEHRTLGLLYQLSKLRSRIYAQKNIAFCYGFTTPGTSVIAQKAVNFVKVGSIPRLVKLLDIRPFLQNKIPLNVIANLLSMIANTGLQSVYRVKEKIPEGLSVRNVNHFDNRFDALWETIRNDYAIMSVRDSRYLNWRYLQLPHLNFKVLSVEDKATAEILGFIVLGYRSRHVHTGYIVDLVTPRNSDPQISKILLHRAIQEFRKKKAALIVCWMFRHCHNFSELAKLGFRFRQEKHRDFVVEILNSHNFSFLSNLLTQTQSWYTTIGDSDFS